MDPNFKTSFIPKRPIVVADKKAKIVKLERGRSIFSYLPILLFLTAIVLSGAVYAYRVTLEGQINSQIAKLEEIKKTLEPPFVGEASRLSDRIEASDFLLNDHLAPTAMFELLEDNTLVTVSFNAFKFADGKDGTIKITASGVADSFASIVLQSDQFGTKKYMKDVIFSDLKVNDDSTVEFSFAALISPKDFMLYKENLRERSLDTEVQEEGNVQIIGGEEEDDTSIEDILDEEFEGFDEI